MSDPPNRLSQYPLVRLRVECRVCDRRGSYSVARLAERFGAEIGLEALLIELTASCSWQRSTVKHRPKQYQQRCLAYLPDLDRPSQAPPSHPRLRLIPKP